VSKHAALQAAGEMPLVERGPGGRFAGKPGRKSVAAETARSILEQPGHIKKLKAQARNGVGKGEDQLPPATHKLLWEYGYGAPQKVREDDDEAMQKMEALRAAAREYLLKNPDHAKIVDIAAQRSAARLPVKVDEPDGT